MVSNITFLLNVKSNVKNFDFKLSTFTTEIRVMINLLQPGVTYLYLPKNRNRNRFLMFSWGIDKQHGTVTW